MTLNDRYNLLNLEHEYWLIQWNEALYNDNDARARYCEGMSMSIADAIESIVAAMDLHDVNFTDDGFFTGIPRTDTGSDCGCKDVRRDIGNAGDQTQSRSQA